MLGRVCRSSPPLLAPVLLRLPPHLGFLLLSQSGDRRERYADALRFDTMPSGSILQAFYASEPELAERIRKALAVRGRPGIRVIAKQFGVSPMTVQNVARC